MVRLGQLLEGPALRAVFERVVQLAVGRRVARGRKMRVDTTVVETPIRYPSDSRLCEDVAQGVCREIERLRSLGVTAPSGFRNVRRSVTRRVREITHVSRRPIARDAKRRALRRPEGHVPGVLAVKHGSRDSKTLLECAALATRATAASRAPRTGPPSRTTSWRSASPLEASDMGPGTTHAGPRHRNRSRPIPPGSQILSSSSFRQADAGPPSPRILHRRVI